MKYFSHIAVLAIALLFVFVQITFSQENINEAVQDDLRQLGEAIEALYKDTGYLLVDLADGETAEGLERINTVFEGAGAAVDGVRTMMDVYAPLVHFGYLDEIPVDPYLPADAPAEWNTYIYADEEDRIPENDYEIPFLDINTAILDHENWLLLSPGEDQTFERNLSLEPYLLSRYQLYMTPPYVDDLLQLQRERMNSVVDAIKAFMVDKGTMLVDQWDDDTPIGQNRLETVLEGVGNVPELERSLKDVLQPLVYFGYLDEIPYDPIYVPYPIFSELPDTTIGLGLFFYVDNDLEIVHADYALSFELDENLDLEAGEWALLGLTPDSEQLKPNTGFPTREYYILGSESSAPDWFHYR